MLLYFPSCGSVMVSSRRLVLNSFDSIFNLQVKTELKKDLDNALGQYGEDGKDGVTKAFDLLQEKVQYYCIGIYLSL